MYLLIGVSYNMITLKSIWNHYMYKNNLHLMNFLFIFDAVLVVVLIAMNVWHWTLAMTGMSTVDVLCGAKVLIPFNHIYL